MRVRCVDDGNSRGLLKNNHVYEVITETSVDYLIHFENGKEIYFRKSRFVIERDWSIIPT